MLPLELLNYSRLFCNVADLMLAQVPTLTFAKKHLISVGFLFFATFAGFSCQLKLKTGGAAAEELQLLSF